MALDVDPDPDMDVDVSWILSEKRLLDMDTYTPLEPASSIHVVCIFVSNGKKTVHKFTLHDISSITIPFSRVQDKIQEYMTAHSMYASYQWSEIIRYHLPIESDRLAQFSKSNAERAIDHFQSIWSRESVDSSLPLWIDMPPSVFIFHDIQCIYCILEEPVAPLADATAHFPTEESSDAASSASSASSMESFPAETDPDPDPDQEEDPMLESSPEEHLYPSPYIKHPSVHPILKHTMKQKPSLGRGITKKVHLNLVPQLIHASTPFPYHGKTRSHHPAPYIKNTTRKQRNINAIPL
jgi:hypothetical protein